MIVKLSCAVASGLCVAAFPGSLAWIVPGLALGAIVVYENTTPEQERAKLLTAACALLPGPLAADLRAFAALPARDKARYLLAGSVPLRPDQRADDNGDGAAEGDTQPLKAPIDPLFAALESRPHRLIIGHTGGGKTTLIHKLATNWADQGQRVIVCDPDAAPGQWPDCIVAGSGDDYAGIGRALASVDREFKRRSSARSAGQRRFTPAHLVIDELQETIDHVDGAWDIIEPVLRRGRKLGLHATLGVQDDQVETLGLHGKSHLLRNTVTVELYQDDRGRRQAAIKNRITDGRPLQSYPVPTLTSPEDLIVVPEPEPPTLVRRAPEPAQTAARLVPTITLAELSRFAPSLAAKRGYQPTDQERAALAGLLDIDDPASTQTVTIARESGDVIVNVQQVAPVTRRGSRIQRGASFDASRRRKRADHYRLVRDAVCQDPTLGLNELRRRLGGDRNRLSQDWNRARRELGIEK